jgi:hypothetical protein
MAHVSFRHEVCVDAVLQSVFLDICGTLRLALGRVAERRFRQEHDGMPTVESLPIFHSTRSLDESLWSE